MTLPAELSAHLATGTVIPAHPLALDAQRRLDEASQAALTRYYVAAGAGGIAVGVHTTQFAIHDPSVGLLEPVLRIAARTLDDLALTRPFLRICGVLGPTRHAVAEAEVAASLGYHAVLLAPGPGTEAELLTRAAQVGRVLPVIGFYLQETVGGRYLSAEFWRRFADLPCVVGIKIAPFDRYRTIETVRGVAGADRGGEVALYTGNDDTIVTDLLTPFEVGDGRRRHIVGGLLGQWAVWTRSAVTLLERAHRAQAGDIAEAAGLLAYAAPTADANGAIFDVAHGFAGCIPGINEMLRRQGLMRSALCLDPSEVLGAGQVQELDRVCDAYPWLTDDEFVAAHRDSWLLPADQHRPRR
ncbi:MAG TPA: dihydrodipicolinate synthase family protein [Pseudonocardia sp.]